MITATGVVHPDPARRTVGRDRRARRGHHLSYAAKWGDMPFGLVREWSLYEGLNARAASAYTRRVGRLTSSAAIPATAALRDKEHHA